jgi:S1-C subfamily serine protease
MRGRFGFGWVAFIAFMVVQALGTFFEERSDRPPIRRPTLPPIHDEGPEESRGAAALPRLSPRDRAFTIETGPKGNGVGTAFAVRDDGIWITARHVVDGCDRVGLVVERGRAIEVQRVQVHPRADIAVLWVKRRAPALSIATAVLRERQAGFHFGFPQGEPGQVTSTLLGRRNMRTTGRYRQTEPVIAWAERRRVPGTEQLGGISGGPAINAAGEIIGVTVAASQRRGRVYTTAPATLAAMLQMAGIQAQGSPSARLNTEGPKSSNFVQYGTALRRQLTVARVVCRVKKSGRRRRQI